MAAIDPRLLADLMRAEGCKLVAYRDGRGFWTIGYGHLLDQSVDWTGHTITQDTANQLLALDAQDRGATPAMALPEWASLDTPCRQNALIECVFNLGEDIGQRNSPEHAHLCRISSGLQRRQPCWTARSGYGTWGKPAWLVWPRTLGRARIQLRPDRLVHSRLCCLCRHVGVETLQ